MKIILVFSFVLLCLSSFGLNPSRTYKQLPDKYNMKYKVHDVKTNDGKANLKAWFFQAKEKTRQLVLISHNGEGNMADYLRRVDAFTSSGFNVVIYDYRGFGESSAFKVAKNMYIYPHFQDDIKSMIDYCRKNFSQTFALYGWGIGGSLSLGVGYRRPEINKIIADTPFLSMEDLESRFRTANIEMTVPQAGYEKIHEPIYTVIGTWGKNLESMLLIVGSNDQLFSTSDMQAIAGRSRLRRKEIYTVQNPDRKDNFIVHKKSYSEKVISFLKR